MGFLHFFQRCPSVAVFAQRIIEGLQQAGDPRDIRFNEATLELIFDDGDTETQMDLGEFYEVYRREDKKERESFLEAVTDYFRLMSWDLGDSFQQACKQLRPQVGLRIIDEMNHLREQLGGDESPPPPYEILAEHLWVDLVYELPTGLRLVQQEDLDRWGVEFAEAFAAACQNLAATVRDEEPTLVRDGVYRFPVEVGVPMARVLLTDELDAIPLTGRPIVFWEESSSLLVASSDNEADVEGLFTLTLSEDGTPDAYLGIPLQKTPEGWCEWLPPLSHPAHQLASRFRRMYFAKCYSWQSDVFEEQEEPQRSGIRIEPYNIQETEEGVEYSYTTVEARFACPALLPLSERVWFYPGETIFGADWQRVEAVLGASLQSLEEYFPPRYRLEEFPSEKQLRAIGTNMLPLPPVVYESTGSGVRVHHQSSGRELELAGGDDTNIEQISRHIERNIAEPAGVFHEMISHLVHVDIHIVPPEPDRDYYTLVTSGMSDRPMSAPPGQEECAYAELFCCLPSDWPMDPEAWDDECNYWPMRLLKVLARLPHEYDTWLWGFHTVPTGDPPEPYAANTKMCCAMLAGPLRIDPDFAQLKVDDRKTINFFSVLPIYREEMEFKLEHGGDALLERLIEAGVWELVDPNRRNVCL